MPDLNPQNPSTPVDFDSTISTLPQAYGWTGNFPHYQYQGFWYFDSILRGVITLAQDDLPNSFQFQPSDIIICSCMKTGTTWLKALVFSIATRNYSNHQDASDINLTTNNNLTALPSKNETTNPLFKFVPHDLIPLLEMDIAQDHKPRDPNLPIFSTHIPFTSLPRSITTNGCKIIYIWRDPKDTFISLWQFVNKIKSKLPKDNNPIPLEQAFDLFSRGESLYGPYWNHVLGYYKASQDFPGRVLFLKYEDMIEDTSFSYVKNIADFMCCPFSQEEESEGVVEKIGKFCSYENMSQLEVNKTGKHRPNTPNPVENNVYFRKGKVGDWKNYLTQEMAQKLDAITREKFGDTSLIF